MECLLTISVFCEDNFYHVTCCYAIRVEDVLVNVYAACLLLCFEVEYSYCACLSECVYSISTHIITTYSQIHQILLTNIITFPTTDILLQQITPPNPIHLHILIPHSQLGRINTPAYTSYGGIVVNFTQQTSCVGVPYFYCVLVVGCC